MRTLSVLFVDDEKLERILLIKGYDWNGKGFEIVGDVSSGIEALELMRTMEPDIVFTDINMAQMDGLEFVSLAKERFKQYQTKYIIITGFRDFEYARQAVKLGVEEFLLKPINFDELDEILNKMRRQICEEQYEREHISTLKRSLAEKTDALKEILFLRLAEKTIVESDAMQQLSQLGCGDLLKKHICCLVLHRQTLFTTVDSELLVGNEQIAEILALWNCICMILHHSGDIIIYCAEPDEHKVLSQAKVFVSLVENTIGSPLYLGISFVQAGFESFYHGFKEAQRPRTLCSFSFNTVCIVSRDFETIINRIPDNQFDWNDLVFALQNNLQTKIKQFLQRYISAIGTSCCDTHQFCQIAAAHLLEKAESALLSWGISFSNIELFPQYICRLDECDCIDKLYLILYELLCSVSDYYQRIRPKAGKQIIERAIAVINENLDNPELGLQYIASQVLVNECYLSRVFKQQMKESLSNYIVRRRVEDGNLMPKITKDDMDLISSPIDFFGQNIYNAVQIRAGENGQIERVARYEGAPKTALNWPITPECLYWGPKFLYERYKKPVLITENGLACHDTISMDGQVHDPNRIDFLQRYLHCLKRAVEDGVDIRGYFHWSLLDNFEWHSGYAERFGLVFIDYASQKRIPKDSAYWYKKVIETNGCEL